MKILTKLCIVCGEEFIKPKSCGSPEWFGCKRRPNGRRFCSKKCSDRHKESQTSWNKNIPWTEDQREKITKIKKGKHYSPKTEFKKGQKVWNEGRAWTSEERKKISDTSYWKGKTGKLSPNWKGGTTKLGQLIRSQRIYYHWRTAVFTRDNWTCINCGAKRSKGNRVVLHCDHRKPFYKILEENKITTLEQAKECEELWDTANGRTLCIPCHKQTPSYLINQHTK